MERYESWFDRAKSSYELAKTTGNGFIYYEDLCYQIQQSVEKSLKGLLLFYETEPDFTHNIEILMRLPAASHGVSLDVAFLTGASFDGKFIIPSGLIPNSF